MRLTIFHVFLIQILLRIGRSEENASFPEYHLRIKMVDENQEKEREDEL